MKRCLVCGVETKGSRGPVSGYVRPLCPAHGAEADREALMDAVLASKYMSRVLDEVLNPRPVIEAEGVQ
jgi:hypothetical protein